MCILLYIADRKYIYNTTVCNFFKKQVDGLQVLCYSRLAME